MFWVLLSLCIVLAAYFIHRFVIRPHSYWIKKGVKQGKPTFLLGDCAGNVLRKQTVPDMIQSIYDRFPENRYSGMYQLLMPMLVLRDPELIKQITVKDFDHFTDHISILPDDYEPLWTRNLFALKGDKWRHMRATLSPAFTSSKMKAMFNLMSDCSEQFTTHFSKQNSDSITVELKDIFTRFTNDVIATCAFGIECNSLKYRENEFYLMGKEATDASFWKIMKFIMYLIFPKLGRLLGVKFFSKRVSEFFRKLIAETVKLREEKNIIRPDMINLMMEAKKGMLRYDEIAPVDETGFATVEESEIGKTQLKNQKFEITDEDMTAQALLFFFGGFDSVSALMCFMGYELAINPDIQDRLRAEIDEAMDECKGKLNYETINKMRYLDMITSETLRKWPAPAVDRVCIDSYTIQPERDGEVPVQLNKGDALWIPIWAIHHDPKYYPNPYKFDPERFSDANKENIKPYTYLPFGMGPRNCIGSRFALLEAKTVFCHLLSKLEIVVTEKTPIPMVLKKNGFNLNAEDGFWLALKPRKTKL